MAANPGLTATAVLSLALGIGANTAIFSILNAVLLRSLPVEDPQRLVQVRMGTEGDDELTNPIWEQVRDRQTAFSGALAYAPDRFDLADGGESRNAVGLWVSGDFFRVLGVPAIEGRVFTHDEDRRGTAPQAVISYSFWKRNFGGERGRDRQDRPAEPAYLRDHRSDAAMVPRSRPGLGFRRGHTAGLRAHPACGAQFAR